MDLELEIEKGGIGDKLAEDLKNGFEETGEMMEHNTKTMAVDTLSGAANVVAGSGFNFGVGDTDQIIADNIAAAVSMTGEAGLMNFANNTEAYVSQLAELGLSAPEQLVDMLLDTVMSVLAENGVIDDVKKGLEVTANTVDASKKSLMLVSTYGTIIANVIKLATRLIKMDPNVTCVPSVKDSMNMITASVILQLKSQYEALKQQLILFYNSMICTSNDSTLDNIIVSVNNILNVIEPLLDPVLQKYTGHTVAEARLICNYAFLMVGMIERTSQKNKKKKEEEKAKKKQDAEEQSVQDSSAEIDDKKKKLTPEEKKKLKEERREKSKQKWKEKNKDLSKEEAKERLMKWLSEQSIMIQNAFYILLIKETIDKIKNVVQQLQNSSVQNQEDLLNMLMDIVDIFEMVGITPDAQGLTLDDLKALGMAVAGTAVQTAVDMAQQVEDMSNEYTQEMMDVSNAQFAAQGGYVMSNNVVNDARATTGAIADHIYGAKGQSLAEIGNGEGGKTTTIIGEEKSDEEVAKEAGTVIATDVVNAMTDQIVDNVVAGVLNANPGTTLNTVLNIKEPFEFIQNNKDRNITIDITIYKNPHLHLTKINSFIKSYKHGNGEQIFNTGITKQIKDAFNDAWDDNEEIILSIQAKVDGITKFYTFTFKVDQESRKNPKNNEVEEVDDTLTGADSQIDSLTGNTKKVGNNIKKSGKKATKIGNDNISMSKLTNVDINIDATAIEQVLQGKILMYDDVVQFLKILLPVVDILKVIIQLLLNYKYNKEWVKTKQHVDLGTATRNAATIVNGLKDIIELNDTNFFVVNTEETANWVKDYFKQEPDENGVIVIGILETTALREYCAIHTINPNPILSPFKGTTIFFNGLGISEGGYKDGTLDGVSNIEFNNITNEVYFDKDQRPAIASGILRARKKGVDPNEPENKTTDIKFKSDENDLNTLLNYVTFRSDEMEGQQTLNMCDLYLCEPDRKQEQESPGNSAVIIEFGDEYTLGNEVEYSISVKPGQTINEGDILGYVTQDGISKPIYTQYKGIIKSVDDSNSDYARIYSSYTKKHIIIENPQKCKSVDYNPEDVIDLQKKFKKSNELESLILNCAPISVLPSILYHANRTNKNSNIRDIYNSDIIYNHDVSIEGYINSLVDANKNLKDDLTTNNSESSSPNKDSEVKKQDSDLEFFNKSLNSKSETSSSSKSANIKSSDIAISKLQDKMNGLIKYRELMIEKAIKTYETFTNPRNCSVYSLNGDYTYIDCKGLVYSDDIFSRKAKDGDEDDIMVKTKNYYINLYNSIPKKAAQQPPVINIKLDDINSSLGGIHDPNDSIINSSMEADLEATGLKDLVLNGIKQMKDATNPEKLINDVKSSVNSIFEDKSNEDDYVEEYRTLIKGIIDNRITIEQQNYNQIEHDFNYICSNNGITTTFNEVRENLGNNYKNDSSVSDALKSIVHGDSESAISIRLQLSDLYTYLVNTELKDIRRYEDYNDAKDITYKETYLDLAKCFVSSTKDIIYNNINYISFTELYTQIHNDNVTKSINEYNSKLADDEKNLWEYDEGDLTIDQIKEVRNETTKKLYNLLKTKTSDISMPIVEYLEDCAENDINLNTSDLNIDTSILGIRNDTYKFIKDIINNKSIYYNLVEYESSKIEEFWNRALTAYRNYNSENAIEDLKKYAENVNKGAEWPQSINIKVGNTNYELYTFTDPFKTPKKLNDNIHLGNINEEDLDNIQDKIGNPVIDLTDIKDIREPDSITIFDYEYWLVYMMNATLFTLIPTYWADGLGIPPFIPSVKLPAVYFPVAPPVMIPMVNVLIVFGLSLRGIWLAPIILMVNLSSNDIDVLIFLKIALEIAKDIFKKMQELVENTIPMMINKVINDYIMENEVAQKAIDKFRTYSAIIHAIPVEDKALIEGKLNDAVEAELNKQNSLNNANSKLYETRENLNQKHRNTLDKVDTGMSNLETAREEYIEAGYQKQLDYEAKQEYQKQQRKAARQQKKYDKRQVVTRESDLGNGPEPM